MSEEKNLAALLGVEWSKNEDGSETAVLADGSSVRVIPAKGKHARKAINIMNGDQSLYMNAIMHQVVYINERQLSLEELDELPMATYNLLMAKLGGNFT